MHKASKEQNSKYAHFYDVFLIKINNMVKKCNYIVVIGITCNVILVSEILAMKYYNISLNLVIGVLFLYLSASYMLSLQGKSRCS